VCELLHTTPTDPALGSGGFHGLCAREACEIQFNRLWKGLKMRTNRSHETTNPSKGQGTRKYRPQKTTAPPSVRAKPSKSWLRGLLLALDKPFNFATRLTSVGAVGVIIAALVQYSSWRDEKNLTRHKEELSSAISTFSEISGALSAVMNLQQILFFTYKAYYETDDEQKINAFFASGKAIATQYVNLRTALRQNIDVLAAKADLFIDRPTTPDSKRIAPVSNAPQVFSNRDSLRSNMFNCERDMPSSNTIEVKKITLDWTHTRSHVWTFYYCLEEVHTSLLPARVWASLDTRGDDQAVAKAEDNKKTKLALYAKVDDQGVTTNDNKKNIKIDLHEKFSDEEMDKVVRDFDRETQRLNHFIALSIRKIEEIRLRAKENGFFRHQFCIFCDN
jgi:hypothetical protein